MKTIAIVAIISLTMVVGGVRTTNALDDDPATPTYQKYQDKTETWFKGVVSANGWGSKSPSRFTRAFTMMMRQTTAYMEFYSDTTYDDCYWSEGQRMAKYAIDYSLPLAKASGAWSRGHVSASARLLRAANSILVRAVSYYRNAFSDC